jgi:cell division protein FtsL
MNVDPGIIIGAAMFMISLSSLWMASKVGSATNVRGDIEQLRNKVAECEAREKEYLKEVKSLAEDNQNLMRQVLQLPPRERL